MVKITRRGLLAGAIGFLAAPAIVRASAIMTVKLVDGPWFTGLMLGDTPIYADSLATVTRKALVPSLIVQVYKENPLFQLLAKPDLLP